MSAWRLEWVRMWRTKRVVVLVATLLILGLAGPIALHYLPDIIRSSPNGASVPIPKVEPVQGIDNLASNVSSIGTLLVAIITASTLGFDTHRATSAFYRSRVHGPALVVPRMVASAAMAIGALVLGTLGAWYETEVLIGHVPLGPLVLGLLLESVWLCLVVAVTAFYSGLIRSVAGTAGASIGTLLGVGILGIVPQISSWLPTRLSGSLASLIGQAAGDIWHALLVAILATVLGSYLGIRFLVKREL